MVIPPRRSAALAGLLLAGLAPFGAARAQGHDPSFQVTNRSATTINEIYVASSAVNEWGADRLGDRTLGSGRSLVVRLPEGQCVNDVRVIYANGEATERRRVNTCSITDLVFP